MKPYTSQLVFALFGLAVITLLNGCGKSMSLSQSTSSKSQAANETVVEVKTVHPQYGEIARTISLPGELRAYQEATLFAKVAGYVRTMRVDKGDAVKTGDLLAEIEAPEFLADKAKLEAETEVARVNYERIMRAQSKAPDLVTPQMADEAKGKFEVAQANLDRNKTFLDYCRITAPFAGIITKRWVDPGAFIAVPSNSPAAQNAAILTLMDFSTVRVEVAIPETEASFIKVGLPVTVTATGLPGQPFKGTVTRFSYALENQTKTMLTEIDIPNSDLQLRPGMYAMVQLEIQSKAKALLIPKEALVMEKANASVFAPVDGKAKKIPIKIGFQNESSAEILEGVQPDQSIILIGKNPLTDGQPIHVAESSL